MVESGVDAGLAADRVEDVVGGPLERNEVAVVADDVVRDGDFILHRKLSSQTGAGFVFGKFVTDHRARDLRRLFGGHHHQRPKSVRETSLDQERGLVAAYRCPLALELAGARQRRGGDPGMGNGLELLASRRISEDQYGHALAVERPIRSENGGAEAAYELREPGCPASDHLARNFVAIDDRQPTRSPSRCDRALARRETARHSEQKESHVEIQCRISGLVCQLYSARLSRRVSIAIPQKPWKIRGPWVCRHPKVVRFDPPSTGAANAFARRFRIRRAVRHRLHATDARDRILFVVSDARR